MTLPETITTPPGWEGILDAGEGIIWQGRPDGRFTFGLRDVLAGLFGFVFAAIALVWMIIAAQAGGYFWAFGLIHFSVGVALAVGGPVWRAYRQRHSWYTLTTRRAFVATDTLTTGRSLAAFPITADTVITLIEGEPGTVHFAQKTRRGRNGTRLIPIGFERIFEAREVLAMMRTIQKATS